MKSTHAGVAAIAAIAFVLTGCSGDAGDGDDAKLEMQTNFAASDPTLQVLTEITGEYEVANPGVKIELVPSTDSYEADMTVRMASGDLPDIWATHGWSLLRYSQFLEPLDGQPWAEKFNEALAPAMKNEEGQFFALPIETDVAGILYNADVLSSVGIDPEALGTWEAFDAALQKLKESGVVPISSSGKDSWFAGNIADFISSGNFPESSLQGFLDGTFDDSGYREIADRVAGWQKAGYFNPDYSSATTEDLGRSLADGSTGFIFVQNYLVATALGFNPDAELGYMPVPSATGEAYLVGGEGRAYGVAKDSAHKEEALDYLAYLAEPENLSQLASSIGGIPGLTDSTTDLGVLESSYQKFAASGDYPLMPYFDRVYLPNGIWDTMVKMTDGLITGQIDAKSAADQMRSAAEGLRAE